MPITAAPGPGRPGIFRRAWIWWGGRPVTQLLVIAPAAALIAWLAGNVAASMARVGISPGFDFLWHSANFEIGESAISFQAGDPYIRAILVGLINTLKVSILGCFLATVVGVAVGVAGLSGNLLLASLVRWYVEVIRNTPLLLQLFFWISLAKAFPAPRQAGAFLGSVYFTNRGVYLPALSADSTALPYLAAAIAVALMPTSLWRLRRLSARAAFVGTMAAAITAIAVAVSLGGIEPDIPMLAGFNIRGGYNLTPEFAALLIGIVVKFSAAIAEIVRAGIQSVKTGQWEAARALGLHRGQIMRLVVLPQALRVITPLTTSSYLDLTKDSSLAVAIGYPDLVSIVNTTANTTGQSLEALTILVCTYLVINLLVSITMNRYNARVALKGAAG